MYKLSSKIYLSNSNKYSPTTLRKTINIKYYRICFYLFLFHLLVAVFKSTAKWREWVIERRHFWVFTLFRGCLRKHALQSWKAGVHSFVLKIVQAVISSGQQRGKCSWLPKWREVHVRFKSMRTEFPVFPYILASCTLANYLLSLNSSTNKN
jgi:hypothetical protein